VNYKRTFMVNLINVKLMYTLFIMHDHVCNSVLVSDGVGSFSRLARATIKLYIPLLLGQKYNTMGIKIAQSPGLIPIDNKTSS